MADDLYKAVQVMMARDGRRAGAGPLWVSDLVGQWPGRWRSYSRAMTRFRRPWSRCLGAVGSRPGRPRCPHPQRTGGRRRRRRRRASNCHGIGARSIALYARDAASETMVTVQAYSRRKRACRNCSPKEPGALVIGVVR